MPATQVVFANLLLILMSIQGCSVHALPPPCCASEASETLTTDSFTLPPASTPRITQTPTSIDASKPGTVGTLITSLETEGHQGSMPFPTVTATSPAPSLTGIGNETAPAVVRIHPKVLMAADASAQVDAFQAVATAPPPSQITSRGDHPVARLGITNQTTPLATNKFYANLFLGSQGSSVFTHPYSVSWSKGAGNSQSWGLAISHIDANQRAYGPNNTAIPGSPASFFINPLGLQSIVLSATEIGSSSNLTTDTLTTFSVNANIQPQPGSDSSIKFPLVQGIGFVTGIYTNLQPSIGSSIFFRTVVSAGSPRPGVFKYDVTLEDGKSWLLYALPTTGADPALKLVSNTLLQGPTGWSGTIQVAKNPAGAAGEAVFDASSGVYATGATVSGSATGSTGTYSISWTKAGLSNGQPLVMFALPHLVSSFDSTTAAAQTNITLQTTTKGVAVAVVADQITMVESALPVSMSFAPWTPATGSKVALSSTALTAIIGAASDEVTQDMGAQSNLDSMYYSGKALSKFASIVYTLHDIANQTTLAAQGLAQLKVAYARFSTNQQIYPLVYDTAWKGVVSSATYTTGNTGEDFGNTLYNDHHFHYGYFIHAAAVIAYLDPTWLAANQDWVQALVRDVSNPSTDDTYFPVFRSFDWFHGHSFAKGLFESGDSKDEESSSEDVMFAYGLKMWGTAIGDASMQARGNLMLSVLARSLQHYFLMASDNTVQPANFIANKVTGILFENKIDHTTYFGTNPEYIQGIHMIPLVPASALTRTSTFVKEEWDAYFADTAFNPANNVTGGWRGILYANLALTDPVSSFNFFANPSFDPSWLDGGASRTWYLAFAAGLGGA